MENHPIPQDVTGFKFKLIGNITVKQFLYLFGAAILSYLFYSSPLFFLIKYPLIFFIAGTGAALAFLPIDGRPLDKMILYYIKAIPRENQYVYKKRGIDLYVETAVITPERKKRIQQKQAEKEETKTKKTYLLKQLRKSYFQPDEVESSFLEKIKPFLEESILQKQTGLGIPSNNTTILTKPIPQRVIEPKPKETTPSDKLKDLQQQLQKAKEDKNRLGHTASSELDKKINELEARLEEELKEKELLQKKLFDYMKTKPNDQVYQPSVDIPMRQTPHVRRISPQSQILAGFPTLPDVPNIVLGIVKDPRGKVLPGIIVEIVDKAKNPVRAFKTNALGQFASATPLANGVYTVFFEDPHKQHEFDTIEIQLTGEIFPPLEIISTDEREKLRKELFGK